MIEILKYEKAAKNKIVGYVDIQLSGWGLIIRRVQHLESGHKKWFNFPAFSQDAGEGKIKYLPYIEFALSAHNGQFFEKLAEKVKEYCEKNNIEPVPPLNFSNDQLPF